MRALLALVLAAGAVPAHLGSGDDVVPRDTVSVIESVTPALPTGIVVDVVGGDTFLRVRSSGHEVGIPGYENEPYIRIRPNGDVFENRSSDTWFLNRTRFGSGTAPQVVDDGSPAATGTESWVSTGKNGTAMWHDHRIHWMSPSTPPTIDGKGTVQEWKVPFTVDGKLHTVAGTLFLRDRASVLWWAAVPMSALVALWFSRGARRRWYTFVTSASALACFVGFLEWWDLPAGARVTPLLLMFGVGALLVANIATALQKEADSKPAKRQKNEWMAASLAAGAGVSLAIVGWMNTDQVRAAYFPFMGSLWLPRLTVTGIIGVGIVAAIDGVVRVMKVEPQQS